MFSITFQVPSRQILQILVNVSKNKVFVCAFQRNFGATAKEVKIWKATYFLEANIRKKMYETR